MDTASYPRIGSKVSYVRQNERSQMVEGTGIVQAIVLDPSKRLMVHLETDELDPETQQKTRKNVHVACLFPSDEFKAQFKATTEAVIALGDEGNTKSRDIVAEYNQRVDAAFSLVLGEAVAFDV